MPTGLGGWSVLGIVAGLAIVAGIVLLIAYAIERGLVHRQLGGVVATESDDVFVGRDGLETTQEGSSADAVAAASGRRAEPARGRALGVAGAVVLAVGLGLGVMTAIAGWGQSTPTSGAGPGAAPADCAQSWSGCAQATPNP